MPVERPTNSGGAGMGYASGGKMTCRKAMDRVLAGIALSVFRIDFLCLGCVLPAAGIVLQILGVRALRRENKWFKACFAVTALMAAGFFASMVMNATVIRISGAVLPAAAANVLLEAAAAFCLWRGLIEARVKASLPPGARAAAALAVWQAAVYLPVVFARAWIPALAAVLVGAVFVFRDLHRLSAELDSAGYVLLPAAGPSDRGVVIAITSALALACTCGRVFGGSYDMRWSPVPCPGTASAEAAAELIELGFPDYVLNDLSPADLAACAGADRVITETGGAVSRSAQEPMFTAVAVHLPDARGTWMVIHHFLWTGSPDFFGTEAVELRSVCDALPQVWESAGTVSGRVLYDRDGQTFAAPYYSIGERSYISDGLFGEQEETGVFAEFSMPVGGENHRGYLAYAAFALKESCAMSSVVNYTHQGGFLQYPAVTAAEYAMENGFAGGESFHTSQDIFSFYLPS